MRIGYYIPGWPPGSVPNGIVTTLGHLGRILRESGHEVFYITPSAPSDHSDNRVLVLERPEKPPILDFVRLTWNLEKGLYRIQSNAIARNVNELVDRFGIDVFQMEETQGWASEVIRKASIPIVVRLHGPWHLNRELGIRSQEAPENRHRVKREGQAIFAAAGVAAPSRSALDLTEQFYGKLPSLTQVIPNPIYPQPQSRRWKLDGCDRELILFVGRFDRIKGADLVLRAFSRIVQRRPTAKLLFVGPDVGMTDEHGAPMNFEQFASKELSDDARRRVEFRGTLSRTEIEALRAKAYMTLVASRYETFGNVVIEAMTFGCPIVTTSAGGISEIITDGRNALVTQLDADAIANSVAKLMDSPGLASRLGVQAALDCSEQFDPGKIAKQTVGFYSTVINQWRQEPNSDHVAR